MNKNNNYFEIIVGTFVLSCAIFFLITSFKTSSISTSDGYLLIAKFDSSDGISNGSDVKISGVKIGTVEKLSLDKEEFRAIVTLKINEDIKLPIDTSVKVASEGLLGSKYLSITPGADDENLENGEEISFTQSSVNLEDLLGKFIFSSNDKSDEDK